LVVVVVAEQEELIPVHTQAVAVLAVEKGDDSLALQLFSVQVVELVVLVVSILN
jgi:hypothetical protein